MSILTSLEVLPWAVFCVGALSALKMYFFDKADPPKAGKRPDSIEAFLKNATLLTMVDASVFYSTYRRYLENWPWLAEALLFAYVQCRADAPQSDLTLDRAFYVVCWTDGMWAASEKHLRCAVCHRCHSRYVAPLACHEHHERDCPFCRLRSRYAVDPRVRSRFPERHRDDVLPALTSLVARLSHGREKPPSA